MPMNIFNPDKKISLQDLSFLTGKNPVIPDIPDTSWNKIDKGFEFLQQYLKNNPEKPVYGINTGFGALCQVTISEKDLEQLQYNLIRSHACGCGDVIRSELVRLMLALKIRSLSYGLSGIHRDTVSRLHLLLKKDWLPVVYENGSLGASGDLAPLAHLSLPLIGEGEVIVKGVRTNTAEIYAKEGLQPVKLHPKEGLALLNGTQFMQAYMVYACLEGQRQWMASNVIALLSGIAFNIRPEPFSPELHKIRPHHGQVTTAEWFYEHLLQWDGAFSEKKQVQDPYSFRCIPQVHGVTLDALKYAIGVAETEINSVTDNPTLFPDENKILSGGNFHGQTLALSMDFLSLALHELGNISERRLYLLLSGQRGLQPFLAARPGLDSGFMIIQYSAASLVSQNKMLTMPSSADSIPSSNGQEDHVSMGANSGIKTLQIIKNLWNILAMELMTAARAIDFKKVKHLPPLIKTFYEEYRSVVPMVPEDHFMHPEIEKTVQFLRQYGF